MPEANQTERPEVTITLTGQNVFLLKTELDRLVAIFVAEHTDMGLERIDGEEAEYDRIRESLESLPFLASKKLVVLRAPSANKQFVENAERLLSNLSDITDVVIVEPKLDKRLSYAKFLQKKTEYKEFGELDENGMSRWLADRAKAQGGSLSMADARYLFERVGANQQLLGNELDKLLLYSPAITKKSIDLMIDPTPQSTIFELLDAAFAGRAQKMMNIYEEQRALKVEPQQIIAMLAWQLHVLAVIKAAAGRDPAAIAKDAKLNPFVVRKSVTIAKAIAGSDLKQLIHDVLDLDIRLKSEAIDADDALRQLLLRVTHG